MVRVTGLKVNAQLIEWIREHPHLDQGQLGRTKSVAYRTTKWRLRDRLTQRDVARLIVAYTTGIAAAELAERYGISAESVRKLLREHSVERRTR